MAPQSAITGAGNIMEDLSNFNPEEYINTTHNSRLYQENQNLKQRVAELVKYQLENPKLANPTTRIEIDNEKKVALEIDMKKKYIRAQMAVIKTLYRQSVMKVRDEKEQTAKSRSHNDGLILGLNNLKYEEQSLRSEISAAENHDHKYKKLPLISVEEFLQVFPEHEGASEQDLMKARIDHEHQVRVKLEERRQEKLKQKQKLIAEVKRGKDDLTKLDGMVEKFIEAAEPISRTLATESFVLTPVKKVVSTTKPIPIPPHSVRSEEAKRKSANNVDPLRQKLTLKERMEMEIRAVEKDIAMLKPTATVKGISKVMVERFGPVFARVVDQFVPKTDTKAVVHTSLALQFTEDMKRYLTKQGNDTPAKL